MIITMPYALYLQQFLRDQSNTIYVGSTSKAKKGAKKKRRRRSKPMP